MSLSIQVTQTEAPADCPLCRASLAGARLLSCEECGVGYHPSCLSEFGASCVSLGCQGKFAPEELEAFGPPIVRVTERSPTLSEAPLGAASEAPLGAASEALVGPAIERFHEGEAQPESKLKTLLRWSPLVWFFAVLACADYSGDNLHGWVELGGFWSAVAMLSMAYCFAYYVKVD